MNPTKQPWFATWFNSPYYHILYQHRNEEEAEFFIDNLLKYLQAKPDANILDLACGKGRHARYIAQKGYVVTGVDLAPESIAAAKKFEKDNLSFSVQDMRIPFVTNKFNYVFNCFTSFGYFEDTNDNAATIQAIHQMLQAEGKVVIDFFNAHKVIEKLVKKETKVLDNISFNITREATNTHIIKKIAFEDAGQHWAFEEKVQALFWEDFKQLLTENGFTVQATFGNYALAPFSLETSDRLIIVAEKIS